MLLNEPSQHTTHPTHGARTGTGTGDRPAVGIDRGPARSRASAEADTVGFVAVDAVDANGGAEPGGDGDAAGSAGDAAGADAISTVALDVAAVKRAAAEAPTVAFSPVDPARVTAEDEISTAETAELGSAPQHPDGEVEVAAPETAVDAETAVAEAPVAETAVAETTAAETEDSTAYLVSSDVSTPTSTVVAVPETADDVIATIHAAATAVARADRRARQAAVVKEDPWTGLDLHQPGAPAPVGNVLDLLAPVLEKPILVVEQPGPPAPADVVALHRSELAAEFVDPPVVAAGAEPQIPPRYGPGLSVLPHIEFPV